MESLLDPGRLNGRPDVDFRDERTVDEREGFEYFAALDGLVAVGVTDGSGAVLLMDSPHGWRLPYGPVDTDEDWVAVGRRIGAALTGVEVTVAGAERVNRITRRLETDDERETTSYDVVLRTVPVTDTPVADDPSFGPWDELELGWFETVPDDAYWDHGDAVDDIRRFVE